MSNSPAPHFPNRFTITVPGHVRRAGRQQKPDHRKSPGATNSDVRGDSEVLQKANRMTDSTEHLDTCNNSPLVSTCRWNFEIYAGRSSFPASEPSSGGRDAQNQAVDPDSTVCAKARNSTIPPGDSWKRQKQLGVVLKVDHAVKAVDWRSASKPHFQPEILGNPPRPPAPFPRC